MKKKKKFLEQERATYSRTIEYEWFVDDYNKEERWILQTVDDVQKDRIVQVDVITCWENTSWIFRIICNVIDSSLLFSSNEIIYAS